MTNFRGIGQAVALLMLFAGLASAQVGTQGITCSTSAVVPNLRSEGFTETSGDLTLTCTGGNATPAGAAIPQATFIIYLNTSVTSRLLEASGTVSEALLLIGEPESGEPGYGPTVPQIDCPTPQTGCLEYVGTIGSYTYAPVTTPNCTAGCSQAPNVFFGLLLTGNSVTFNGVPVLAPGTTSNRIFRFTNIRANADQITGRTLPGTFQDVLSISSSTSITLNTYSATTGIVNQSLSTSVIPRAALAPQSCSDGALIAPIPLGTLTFSDTFAGAFKTRVSPLSTNQGPAGLQSATAEQNIPGQTYLASETDLTPYNGTVGVTFDGSVEPGLADYGTRLKAVFSYIPEGVNLWVQNTPATATEGASAWLIPNETGAYSAEGKSGGWTQLSVSDGTAIAVWEVTEPLGISVESLGFEYGVTFARKTACELTSTNPPSVSLSYGPTATQGAFSVAAGAAASYSLPIPRFADTSMLVPITRSR